MTNQSLQSRKILFTILMILGAITYNPFFDENDKLNIILLTIAGSWVIAVIYFIQYLIHAGVLKEIFKGILIAIGIIFLSVIPIVGQIILIGFILYNLANVFESLKNLMKPLSWCLLMHIILIAPISMFDKNILYYAIGFLIYSYISYFYCLKTNLDVEDASEFWFRISTMILAIPLVALIIISLASMIRSLFTINTIIKPQTITKNIDVRSHMRGDTLVRAHTRAISQTVNAVTNQVTVNSAAAMSSSGLNVVAEKVQRTKKITQQDVSKLENTQKYRNIRFYQIDEFNKSNLREVITEIFNKTKFQLNITEVIAYLDESISQAEYAAIILTQEFLCVFYSTQPKRSFLIRLDNIKNLNARKKDKFIIFNLLLHNKSTRLVILQHAQADAKKMYQAILQQIRTRNRISLEANEIPKIEIKQ